MTDKVVKYAFPRPTSAGDSDRSGMTLREYYAGQALAGYLASGKYFNDEVAKFSFHFADEMMKILEKENQ